MSNERSFTIKSEDPGIVISDAISYLSDAKYQGTFKGYQLKVGGSSGLLPKTYWYALKDEENYADRGLTGLLDYIESKQLQV